MTSTTQSDNASEPLPAPTSPDFTNGIGMAFIEAPPGAFFMGSDPSFTDAQANEMPRHEVTIRQSFLISQFEVTQEQWIAVMGFDPYTLDRSNPYYSLPGMAERLDNPANPATVSWNDAQSFITQLNELEGTTRYRLPTEAEWEYAARAGTDTAYSFGDDTSQLDTYGWYGEDFAAGSTHPVGQKQPNPWGLHDVHGNVWEWTQDTYAADYYARTPSVDPPGPQDGSNKVVRGGSWHQSAGGWHSSFRQPYDSDYRGISIGFRVVAGIE